MLKDFVGKKVKVTVAFSRTFPGASVPMDFIGVLTECDENYIKLDDNTVLSSKFITSVILAD